MWRALASNVLTILIVAFLALIGIIAWGQREYTAPGPLAEATFFEVPRGASLTRVADDLAEAGVISSPTIFRLGAQYSELDDDLKFGNYEVPANISMEEVLGLLTQGAASSYRYVATYVIRVADAELRLRERIPGQDRVVDIAVFGPDDPVPAAYADLVQAGTPVAYRVSIAEGATSWQITDALSKAEFLTGEIGPLPPEGSLAPDTYDVTRGTERAALLARMSAAQERILAEAWAARKDDLPVTTPEEALILASIIEKETSVPDERGVVSSVFVNRLREGMRLQTDPTVIYGVTRGVGTLGRGIRQSELRGETPWNTYVIPGLPPTPIANPGRDAIFAAVNPDDTDYIFFVADGTGGHAFAETLAEHNRNVSRWREIEAERRAN
ncbi:endolytic transglycosylase MltG [Tropicimonas sp. S265A]|uniref:endolytic transglycosylase MltG n=1 Tax=Tropicimonas sp. S265A TaxID=3415134 RepID=UPI003C7D8929